MEYTQMTLNDWVDMKEQLKNDIINANAKLNGLKKDFVRIGFKLRKIEDQKLYEKDGYKSIAEFAQAECGLTSSDVTRFMQINEKYSVGGYSEELRTEFLEYGSSKLSEMLTLPDKELEMIKPEMTRAGIRELKNFNKSEPASEEADNLLKLIESFYEENEGIVKELYQNDTINTADIEDLIEIVNPSGNRSYRKGLFFVMMYEENIKIKKYGQAPESMNWLEFFEITRSIFEQDAAGADTYKNHFCSSQSEEIPGQMKVEDYPELMPEKELKKEEIAPAQNYEKTAEILNEKGVLGAPKKEKTEEEKYSEEQAKIDRETKKKLQEMEDDKKMETLPSEKSKDIHQIRVGKTFFQDILKGIKNFTLRKKDRDYKVGDLLDKMEFEDGRFTGRLVRQEVIYILEDYAGLQEGYCIMGTKLISIMDNEK